MPKSSEHSLPETDLTFSRHFQTPNIVQLLGEPMCSSSELLSGHQSHLRCAKMHFLQAFERVGGYRA